MSASVCTCFAMPTPSCCLFYSSMITKLVHCDMQSGRDMSWDVKILTWTTYSIWSMGKKKGLACPYEVESYCLQCRMSTQYVTAGWSATYGTVLTCSWGLLQLWAFCTLHKICTSRFVQTVKSTSASNCVVVVVLLIIKVWKTSHFSTCPWYDTRPRYTSY